MLKSGTVLGKSGALEKQTRGLQSGTVLGLASEEIRRAKAAEVQKTREYAEKVKKIQAGNNDIIANITADLKSGTNSAGKRKMSAGLDYYVNGSPIPSKNPAPGVAAVNKAAEDYAKKATAGDGYESLSLDELKLKTEKAKKDYENGFKGENIIQTGLNLLGGHNAYKNEYEKLREAYNNRLNAFNEYNRNIALQKGEKTYDEKEYDIKPKGALGKTVDVLEHIDNTVSAGGNMFRQGANATMNATLGNLAKAFGFKNNIFQQGYDYANYANDKANEKMELSAKQLGDKNNISGTLGANFVNMALDMAPLYLLGGTLGGASTLEAAAKANLGLGAKSTSLLTATQRGITELAKNPMFFTSFAGEVGNDYYEAMANGATESQAMLAALTASTVNAALEVGGVQELPSKLLENKSLGKKTLDWVLSSLSEGKEEVLQDFISQLSAKAIYDKDKEVFSLSDQGAIINPERMAKEFGLGAAAGGIMGGGMLTFNSIVNSKTKAEYKRIGETARKLGDVDGLINYAQRSIDNDIRTLAYNTDSDSISNLELGQLYAYACRDIDGAINSPKELNTAIDNFNEIASSTDSKLINGIASSRIIERMTSAGIDSESAKYMAESAKQTDTVNSANETSDLQSTAKADDTDEVNLEGESGDDIKPDNDIYNLSKNILPSTENKKERKKITLAEQQTIKKFAEGLRGKKVEFFDAEKRRIENGLEEMPDGYTDGETLYISDRAKNPFEFVLAHEFTDSVAMDYITTDENGNTVFTKEYEELINYTLKSEAFLNYAKTNGYDTAIRFIWATVKKRQNAGDSNFVGKSKNEARKQACIELFSDFIGSTVTGDINNIKIFADKMNNSQKNTFFTMMKNFIAKIKANVASFVTGDRKHIFLYEIGIIENKLAKLYQNAPATTEGQYKNTADNSGARYSFVEYGEKKDASNQNRKSEYGELRNEFYDALDKRQWKSYYEYISKNGYLCANIGDTISTLVDDKLILSERVMTSDNSNDFQVYEVYQIKGEDSFKMREIKDILDEIMESGVKYDREAIYQRLYRIVEATGKGEVLTKFDRNNARFNNNYTVSGKQRSTEESVEVGRTGIKRTGVQNGNKQIVQGVSKDLKPNIRYSIPTEQASLLDRYDRGEISREEYLNQSNENWKEAVNNYGTIETGENPVDDIPVPQSVDGKQKTQRFARTVIESGKLTNRMVEDMGADILLGKFAYTPVSDESAQATADKAVKGGFAESSWQEAVNASKLITKDKIAIGEKLLMQAIANKDTKRALELSSELADVLTRNGQNIQAASMFKKMTGAGKLLTVQQYVNTLNKDLEAKYGENAPTVKINEIIAEQIAESKPGEDIESLYEDALQDVAAQVPATFLDKWNAWRYMSMLVNPTTHIRNIAGNGLFIPSVRMKDFISASLETAFIKDKDKRTKSVVIKKEYKEFAEKDLTRSEVKNALKSGGKFNIETEISEKQRIFKNNALEFVRVGNGNLLETEDLIFKNIHYKRALAGFLQARGADLNNIDESLLWEARAYAVQEAMKATFNDANSISTALSAAANKNNALNIAINGVLPFKKTPVNIVRRGVEYSPLGLLKTVVKGSYELNQGKITASEYIDGLGAGISGSIVFAIGTLLSSLGWATGGLGDDDEDKFKKLNGEQEYALQLFGKSYTIDWAAPACIPFFIGVETVNALREDNGDFKLSDITEAMWNSLEPVINLSMLSGVQSMIESVKYAAEDKSVISLAGNIAKSYFSQGLPTVLGKTARTLDSKRRSNYIDKNSQLSEFTQSAINTAKSKIPGLEATRPEYINAWGQAESNGNIIERIFGNFVSPGYYSDIEYSEMSEELLRLSEAVKGEDVSVFPKTAQKSFEVNGKTKYLTAEEYTKYAKAKGQYSYDYVSEFLNSAEYKKLTDEERAKVISNLYKYANAKAKTEVSDYDITKSFKSVSQWEKRGKSPVVYYLGKVLSEK